MGRLLLSLDSIESLYNSEVSFRKMLNAVFFISVQTFLVFCYTENDSRIGLGMYRLMKVVTRWLWEGSTIF